MSAFILDSVLVAGCMKTPPLCIPPPILNTMLVFIYIFKVLNLIKTSSVVQIVQKCKYCEEQNEFSDRILVLL